VTVLTLKEERKMLAFFDRKGKRIENILAWAKLVSDAKYKRIDESTLSDGTWISTVWLGANHRFGGGGPPLIFETMVFKSGDSVDVDRYATEADAIKGHQEMVAKWQRILKQVLGHEGFFT
jgi:hypothetical protein